MKHSKVWYLLVICFLILSLAGLTSCDMFDDDDDNDTIVGDDDDDDIGIPVQIDSNLVGTWLSSTPFSPDITDKLVLTGFGRGKYYSAKIFEDYEAGYIGVLTEDDSIVWSAENSVLSIVTKDSITKIFANYWLESQDNRLRIENGTSEPWLFIRPVDNFDTTLVGNWECHSVNGIDPNDIFYEFSQMQIYESGRIVNDYYTSDSFIQDDILVSWNTQYSHYHISFGGYSFSEGMDTLYFDISLIFLDEAPYGCVPTKGIFTRSTN